MREINNQIEFYTKYKIQVPFISWNTQTQEYEPHLQGVLVVVKYKFYIKLN